jgi:hypothetical protein
MWRTVRRITFLAVLVTTGIALPPAKAAGTPFGARSEKGLVAYGTLFVNRDSAPSIIFEVRFVVPQGPTVSTDGVLPSGVDLSRPWVAVSAGSSDGSGHCSTFANPSSYSAGSRKGDRWTGLFVDVVCDDGADYGFYRVSWTSENWLISNPMITATTGSQPVPFGTDVAHGVISSWPEAEQMGGMTVCGFRHGRAPRCFGGGQGTMLLSAAGVVTTGTTL